MDASRVDSNQSLEINEFANSPLESPESRLYTESMYGYFKRARVQNLLGQYGSSVFIVALTWNIADQFVLLAYLAIHQFLVSLVAVVYYSKWTNKRLSAEGLPRFCLLTGILARLFCGSIFWLQIEACQDTRFPLSVFLVLAALAIGTIVTIGPLKVLSRNTLICLLAPGALACLYVGNWALGLAALYFLYVVAINGVNKMHTSYCQLIALRHQTLLHSAELQEKNDELTNANASLATEIAKREVVESEREEIQEELLRASCEAGKSEIATGVLHNVGNVINSVNVSVELMQEEFQNKLQTRLAATLDLLKAHEENLASFFADSPRGKHFVPFISGLVESSSGMVSDFVRLREHVDHVKAVVAAQQSYASIQGLKSEFDVNEATELAIEINREIIRNDQITVLREFEAVPTVFADKQKLIQILINLLKNALNAIRENADSEKILVVKIYRTQEEQIAIQVIDTGIGISSENITKIFQHGFSTQKTKGGKGFGLHHSICTIREMGGNIDVESNGLKKGATFSVFLPITREVPLDTAVPIDSSIPIAD